MAPPPPSQAGKFKPRKPAKKISVGAAMVPDGAPSSSSALAAAAAAAAQQSRGGGGGRGGRAYSSSGRGGGRTGGRDGGGRGGGIGGSTARAAPQGRAFFTAQPAAVLAAGSSRQRRSAAAAASQQQQQQRVGQVGLKREGATEEEIVGTLEEAVGSNTPASTKSGGENSNFSRDTAQTAFERALMGGEDNVFAGHNQGPEGYLYDSDSSLDEEIEKKLRSRQTQAPAIQQPLTLPFPPVGGVDDSRGALYPVTNDTSLQRQEKPHPSPFVHTGNKQALKAEKDAWFLVQLPTRLPPVQQKAAPKSNGAVVEHGDSEVKVTNYEETAMVATAPMQLSAFDNALTNAVPGRVGTIKIYKSGKTVLIMEGPDGAPTIVMNVSEGLSCGFQQQAVAINLENGGDYVPLGPVQRTLVITPDLKGAFQSS